MARHLRWALLGLALVPSGCKKRVDAPNEVARAAASTVDVAADRVAARASWLLTIAQDPAPLAALAGSSEGWRPFFEGDIGAAFKAFEGDAEASSEARIGLARTALALAEAHAHLGELQAAITPRWLRALETRPNTAETKPWRAYLSARLAARTGSKAAVPAGEGVTAPWMAGLSGQPAALGRLLAGQAAGADAALPAGGTTAYESRLRIPALVRAKRLKEARRLAERLDPKQADLVVGAGDAATALWDPAVAGGLSVLYAGVAHAALEGEKGWPLIFRARAELLIGSAAAAAATLDGLLDPAAKPAPPSLAQLVLSGALDAGDLAAEAAALRVVAVNAAGDGARAKALSAELDVDTVGRRVLRAWAASHLGLQIDAGAFPDDRDVLLKAISDEVDRLGSKAKGRDDVAQLMLVDRYVDAVQRRFADTLARAGKPALAVKAWQAAQDKRDAMAPSARNRLPSLVAAARDQVRIGQRRVGLKYLSRLASRLPAAAGPAEMLRDLLSLQAMENGGSATAGQ